MKTGLMVSAPLTEFEGRPIDLNAHLEALRRWGCETLDIFPGFLGGRPAVEMREALDRYGMSCACYYVGADLCADPSTEAFKEGIETAQTLGSPIVFTHGTQHTHAGEEDFAKYAEGLSALIPLFDAAGITLVVENAGTLMHSIEDCRRMMELLAPQGLRFCVDTGNFFLWGQDEVLATEALLPWTIHFHVKDYTNQRWPAPGPDPDADHAVLGEGQVRHAPIMGLLRQAGYAGTLALEPPYLDWTAPGLGTLARWTR